MPATSLCASSPWSRLPCSLSVFRPPASRRWTSFRSPAPLLSTPGSARDAAPHGAVRRSPATRHSRRPTREGRGRHRAGDPEGARGQVRAPHAARQQRRPHGSAPTPEADAQQATEPTRGTPSRLPQKVSGYATVGVTWKHGVTYADDADRDPGPHRGGRRWSKWMDVEYHDDHGPDGATSEEESARERPGTDALVIGDVDRVQMRARDHRRQRAAGPAGSPIIDPGTGGLTKQAPGDRHREAALDQEGGRPVTAARRRPAPPRSRATASRTRSRSAR